MQIDEGLLDDISNYLKGKGIIDITWKGRNLSKRGAGGLNQLLSAITNFNDTDMLEIVKMLYKKGGNDIFLEAGFTNTENDVYEYTFLDLAIMHKNYNTLLWLIDNITGLYIAGRNTFKNRPNLITKNPQWFQTNGLKLIDYLTNNLEVPSSTGYKNYTKYGIDILFNDIFSILNRNESWASFNDIIAGITKSDNNILNKILLNHKQLTMFVMFDDVDFLDWILKHDDWHWSDDYLLKHCIANGKINTTLSDNSEILMYIQNNSKKLGVNIENWLTKEAKDIFLF